MSSASCHAQARDGGCEEPGGSRGDTHTATAGDKEGDPGKEPAVPSSGLRASAHLPLGAEGGLQRVWYCSGLMCEGRTDP